MIIAWMLLKSNDFMMKRVKTALLFNDKYKQGYSYIMPNFFSLPIVDQAKLAQDALFKYYGVTIPVTTEQSKNNLIKAKNSYVPAINQINSALWQGPIGPNGQPDPARAASARAANNSAIPDSLKNQLSSLLPTGYTFDGTLGQLSNTFNAMSASVDLVIQNQTQLPPKGAGVTYNPTYTTPPVGTNVTAPTITPPVTTPATTTAPSTNPPSSILSNVLTAAAVVGGGAIAVNALNNRVQNSTPTPVTTPTTTTTPEVPQTSPTNVVTPVATTIPLTLNEQQPINPNSDPNTNIGELAQDLVYEPLQEPPATEVDEFTGIDEQIERQRQIDDGTLEFAGIDEQVERQRQLEDGSLEFAGIDEQIGINENALQEPPQLSDDEVNAYLRTVGQDENIENAEAPTATGYGDDPGEEFTTDSLGNTYKNGVLFRAAEVSEDPSTNGLTSKKLDTQSQATQQDVSNFQAKPDWRVRLSLAPGATYLYKDKAAAGILAPLAATDGVIFPYTPAISVQYAASYDATELTHSNYKFFTYRGSAVDSVSITCDFTAQDTFEANYLLAVIHFFRSVTKMFYGQDQNPKIGTPPPLCYLSGLGAFQFDAHPLAITAFNYTLPTDVDYIRAGSTPTPAGVSKAPANTPVNSNSVSGDRLAASKGTPGGGTAPPQFTTPAGSRDVTYVPTKMSISIQAVPIVTRNDISNKFSLKEYGTGKLLRGTQRQGGGIW